MGSSEQVRFDYYGLSVIFNNYANYHIFSEEDMFTDNIEPIIYNGVATIGVKDIIIGTFIWYWNDDEGRLQTNKLKKLL